MSIPSAEQIRRYQMKNFARGDSLRGGFCIRCGGEYINCPCTAFLVLDLADKINRLSATDISTILQGATVPKTTTQKADDLIAKANELLKEAKELKAQAAKEAKRYPKEPSARRLSINVQYSTGSNWYEYLVLRVPGKGYYTTGRGTMNTHFETWEAMVDWLTSADVKDWTMVSLSWGSETSGRSAR